MSLRDVQNNCYKKKSETICDLIVPHTVYAVQLPIYYYAHMLQIKVDGRKTPYYRSLYQNNILAAVKLKPGQHTITMQFVGLQWANWISFIAWMVVLMSVLVAIYKKYFKQSAFT